MAESGGADFQRKGALTFYTLLLAGGIALYWIWAVLYDTWYPFTRGNIAIYVVYMPMIAFGVIGILLYKRKKPLAQ